MPSYRFYNAVCYGRCGPYNNAFYVYADGQYGWHEGYVPKLSLLGGEGEDQRIIAIVQARLSAKSALLFVV